jgi:cytochrome o ubiquinol oxidase subunit 1
MMWFLGFVVTFTIGGMTGVLMSVPAIDFQVHNSLFLVAHFHNMIIGGVLFGYFAGLAYWFPKITGFRLNERLGKYAFWLWIVGFLLAFLPLYALGLMGATRRLDHYDASMGWQGLFIVAGVGAFVICLGIGMQILQLIVSIFPSQRRSRADLTGDPWDGRTLEWSTSSPAPVYNFALVPIITDRDAFWVSKQADTTKPESVSTPPQKYEAITLPKNSGMAIVIAGCAVVFGFALIWHIWWLAIVGFVGIIASIVIRSIDDDAEYTIPAHEVALIEEAFMRRKIQL